MIEAGAASLSPSCVLADIADLFESSVDAELRLGQALRLLNQVVPYDVCALIERRVGPGRLIVIPDEEADATLEGSLVDLLAELTARRARPAVLERTVLKWASHLAMPLIGLDEIVGVLFVGTELEDQYSPDQVSTFAVMAAQVAAYLTNLFLAEQSEADRGRLDEQLSRNHSLFLSEHEARTAAEAAIRSRDEFLASGTHDLRTPLTSIKGRAQLLRRSLIRGALETQRILDELAEIIDGTSRMERQIDQIFAVALDRVEKEFALRAESTDIVGLVRECIAVLAPLHQGRVLFAPAVQPLVGEWDTQRLSRVFANLISNAVKFSPAPTPIQITLTIHDRHVPGVLIDVRDQGIGIPESDLAHIFEPFHRGANSSAIPGTGLGLAGSKSAVELHGGTLSVVSQVDRGSTFTVWLPLRPATA